MQYVEELLGTDSRPVANANAEAATKGTRVIGKQVALVDDIHFRLERTTPDARSQRRGRITKHEDFAILPTAPPTRRKCDDRSILGDHWGPDPEATTDNRELDERAARGKDELDMWTHSFHVPGSDGQAIVRVQKRSIDIAEQGNSWKRYGAQRTRAHGP
jgi:hypothetical protein